MMDNLNPVTPVQTHENSFKPGEKWRIWRNVTLLGFAFMLHFTAFFGASNLQSSVNANEALGTSTLATIYGSLLLSNLVLPTLVIKWFGCKWTIALSLLAYVPFTLSQFYANFYTMIPSGLIVGLAGGPLWCAQCTFLAVLSETYSKLTGTPANVVLTRFFSVFFMIFILSQVWGNLISSAVLSYGNAAHITANNNTYVAFVNQTFVNPKLYLEDIRDICGAKFCPGYTSKENRNLTPPPVEKIQVIAGIYLACMVVACLTIVFGVDSLKRFERKRSGGAHGLSSIKLLTVTLKHALIPYQILITPIIVFIGAEVSFLGSEYTASFVSCGWGISNIGYVMICFGISHAIAAILIGGIVKAIGRNPIIAFAVILHLSILVTLLLWAPTSGNKLVFFVITGVWGICDAVWMVQFNALSGILFPGKEEAAYSNFRLWESVGSAITYIYSPYLCTNVKIYLLMGLLLIGVSGYTAVEVMQQKYKKINVPATGEKFRLVQRTNKTVELEE